MLVSTQDGVYTAVRSVHNHLIITSDNAESLKRLAAWLSTEPLPEDKTIVRVEINDQEFVEFLTAHVQDIQYTEYPPPV